MSRQSFDRRFSETLSLAVLATATVGWLRFSIDPTIVFSAEFGIATALTLIGLIRLARAGKSPAAERMEWLDAVLCGTLVLWPIVVAVVGRAMGFPIAFEMTALSTFGCAAISMSFGPRRMQAMSLVASGFLMLFVTAVSEHGWAMFLAVLWIAICVWHLVTNHWERLEVCQLENVRRTAGVRPLVVVMAVALCVVGGLAVKDRMGPSKLFNWGFMPTSGGSQWSDPAALEGVGDGDAAIAGKEHAESFGAVESDLFMESTESTLFDMFSDNLGEPQKPKIHERRQGMMAENLIQTHDRSATSEKGGSSFTTERMPPKRHRHHSDAIEKAIFQWSGPGGIRLAMHRYDVFDGVEWTASESPVVPELLQQKIDGVDWFFDPKLFSLHRSGVGATVAFGTIKVLRLPSNRLPCPMMAMGLHIRGIDRADFFGIQSDECLFMPGRERVPPLTVVRVASQEVMEDEIIEKLVADQATTAGDAASYEKLKMIVDRLRTEFTLDPEFVDGDSKPLDGFLKHRRGGKHLFATAAAVMAREIGLKSRLVTGFYVRPLALDVAAGHANVMAEDVHAWAEVQLTDGRWIEIEATPGYRQPVYRPSLWLTSKRFAAAYWIHGVAAVLVMSLVYVTRTIWIDVLLIIAWWCSGVLRVRTQLRLALCIVETRAWMAKRSRAVGTNQREWLLMIAGKEEKRLGAVRRLCDAADQAVFGKRDVLDRSLIDGVVSLLNMKLMKQNFASEQK